VTLQEWLSILVPTGVALFVGAIGYGRLQSRMSAVESENGSLREDVKELQNLQSTVARIDERTKSMAQNTESQAKSLERITNHFLDEGRSFAREIIRRDQSSPRQA
jgi:Tfp pilus assembly protein PilN